MRLSIWRCTVFLAVTYVALISEARKEHGKSERQKFSQKETEKIYTEVLHNITRVNKELQNLLNNYNKLKGIYDQHSSFEFDPISNDNNSRKDTKHKRITTERPTRSVDLPTQMFDLIEDDENSTEMEIETKATTKAKKSTKKEKIDFFLNSEELQDLKADQNKRFRVKHKRKKEETEKEHKRKKKFHKTTPEDLERLDRVGVGHDTSSEDEGTLLHYGKRGQSANHKKDNKKLPSNHNLTKHLHSAKPDIKIKTKKVVEGNSEDARERTKTVNWQKKNERREFNVAHAKDTSSDTDTTDSDTDTVDDMNNSNFFFLRSQTDISYKDSKTRRFSRSALDIGEDEIDTASKEDFQSAPTGIRYRSKPTLRKNCINADSKRCKRDLVRKCFRAGKGCLKKVCRIYACKSDFKEEFDQILRKSCIEDFHASNVSGSSSRSGSSSGSESGSSSASSSSSSSNETRAVNKKQLDIEVSNEQDTKNITSKDSGKKSKNQINKNKKSVKKKKKTNQPNDKSKKNDDEKTKNKNKGKEAKKKKNKKTKKKETDTEGDSDEDKEAERTGTPRMKALESAAEDLTRHGFTTSEDLRRSGLPESWSGGNISNAINQTLKEHFDKEKKKTQRARGANKKSKLKIGRKKKEKKKKKKKKKTKCCGDGAKPICVKTCTSTYTKACELYECLKDKRKYFKKQCKKFCREQFPDKSSSSSSDSGSSSGSS